MVRDQKMGAQLAVLVVTEEPSRSGGAPKSQLYRLEQMSEKGVDIALVTVNCDSIDERWIDSARLVLDVRQAMLARWPNRMARLVRLAGNATSVARGAARLWLKWGRRPDVVYAAGHDEIFVAGLMARLLARPLVLNISSPASWRGPLDGYSGWRRFGMDRADRYVFVSGAQRDDWVRAGVLEDRAMVIHNGVDLDRFRPGTDEQRRDRRASFGLGDDDILVLFAGRLDEDKGAPWLVDAFRRADVSRAHLLLFGIEHPDPATGERQRQDLLERMADSPHVHLRPATAEIQAWFDAADVVVVPSLVAESFSRVILEAMASGTPVVVSDRGGNREAVGSAQHEWVYDPEDVSSFESALRAAAGSKHDREALRARSRKHAVEHLDGPASVDRLLGVFEQLIDGGRAA